MYSTPDPKARANKITDPNILQRQLDGVSRHFAASSFAPTNRLDQSYSAGIYSTPTGVTEGDELPDDVVNRQTDKRHVINISDNPGARDTPSSHFFNPRVYVVDAGTKEAIRDLNNGLNWREALFSTAGPGHYFARFPETPHAPNDIDFVDLTFGLNTDSMSHAEFVRKYMAKGGAQFVITKAQLADALEGKVDLRRSDYHIVPHHIKLVYVESNSLPVPFDITLRSKVGRMEYMSWSRPRGVNSYVDNTKSGNDHTHLILAADTKGEYPSTVSTLFVANDLYNSPEFAQYINMDFDSLTKELYKLRNKVGNIDVYKFNAPSDDTVIFSLPFWVTVTEWPTILLRSKAAGLMSENFGLNEYINDPQGAYIMVPKDILDSIINDKKAMYNKSRICMNINELVLDAKPLLGARGWEDYAKIASLREHSLTAGDANNIARLRLTLRIVFQKYDGPQTEVESENKRQAASINPTVFKGQFW